MSTQQRSEIRERAASGDDGDHDDLFTIQGWYDRSMDVETRDNDRHLFIYWLTADAAWLLSFFFAPRLTGAGLRLTKRPPVLGHFLPLYVYKYIFSLARRHSFVHRLASVLAVNLVDSNLWIHSPFGSTNYSTLRVPYSMCLLLFLYLRFFFHSSFIIIIFSPVTIYLSSLSWVPVQMDGLAHSGYPNDRWWTNEWYSYALVEFFSCSRSFLFLLPTAHSLRSSSIVSQSITIWLAPRATDLLIKTMRYKRRKWKQNSHRICPDSIHNGCTCTSTNWFFVTIGRA